MRAKRRLRALGVGALDVDEDPELRDLSLDLAGSEEVTVRRERCPAVHAKRLGDSGDDEEKADVRESMAFWDQDGLFVLLWDNDYWLNGSGEVVSS